MEITMYDYIQSNVKLGIYSVSLEINNKYFCYTNKWTSHNITVQKYGTLLFKSLASSSEMKFKLLLYFLNWFWLLLLLFG